MNQETSNGEAGRLAPAAQCYAAGEYVLASKYRDGDPQDHWCVGVYKEAYLHCGTDQRHIVVDGNGQPFRANGFRRVKKISKEHGAWMLKNARIIETSGMSVWHFARCSMKPHNAGAQRPAGSAAQPEKKI